MIEVEVRGMIKESFDEFVSRFRKIAEFKGEKQRISFVYFKHDMNVNAREILDYPIDLRLRVTNKKAEIIIKYGKWGGSDSREEYSVPIKLEDFESAVSLLKCLGWHKGLVAKTHTFVFEYKGIEFALVKYHDKEHYFEGEKMVRDKKDIEKEKNKIISVCKELGLSLFGENDFIDYINHLNGNINHHFDFEKKDFSYWKGKFKELF